MKRRYFWPVAVAVVVLLSAAAAAAAMILSDDDQITAPVIVNGKDGVVLENLRLSSTTGGCVLIQGSRNVTIRNSEIGPCAGNAVEVKESSNVRIVDSYIHPEFPVHGCCDKGNAVFVHRSSNILIQGNVIAYGESNVELLGVQQAQVVGNFLLNPLGPFPRGQQVQVWGLGDVRSSDILIEDNYTLASKDPSHKFPDGQLDAINLGLTDRAIVKDNHIVGGTSDSGCGLIADSSANDMQFLNNHVIMHTRQAYEDYPEPGRRRHLLRIWIIARGCRPLPRAYFARHGDPDKVDWPGGIVGPDSVLNAPIERE